MARLAWLDRIPDVGNAAAISGILADDWQDKVKSTPTQREWLHHVQKSQDARQSWGQAVDETQATALDRGQAEQASVAPGQADLSQAQAGLNRPDSPGGC
jgi:hypothetical protein